MKLDTDLLQQNAGFCNRTLTMAMLSEVSPREIKYCGGKSDNSV